MSAFRLIAAEKANHPVDLMCRVLGVSRSGFYAWSTRAPSSRALHDAWLIEQIGEIHAANRGVYGSPRIQAELRMARGIRVGRKRVERLMRKAGISGLVPKKRGRTTIRVPGVRVADDLVNRDFQPRRPTCSGSPTSPTSGPGRAGSIWWPSRMPSRAGSCGWSMADHMRSDLVVDALNMAVARRRPDAGLIHHSDQGSQFVSLAFGQACGKAGIARSMGSRGDCFDNAVAESFFATLKKELIRRQSWPTRTELRQAVFEYIELFYNATRRHSTLGMVSPAEFEQTSQSLDQQD